MEPDLHRLAIFYRSTIGKKIIMAVTGLVLVGFLLSHVLANLLAFQGPEQINHYAAFLRSLGGGLWLARGVLLLALVLHVTAAVELTLLDRAARPEGYARQQAQASTAASRTLRVGGVVLLAFIIYHLLHFTLGTVHPDFVPGDVYRNVVVGFQSPLVVGFYLVAMAALGLHLFHGGSSMFQSLGLAHPSYDPGRQRLMRVLGVLVALGFAAVPLGVLVGVIR